MRSPPAARRGRRVLSRPDARPSAAQKVERLAAGLHLLGAPSGGSRHTLFVDDAAAAASFDAAAHFETAPELLPRRFNRPRLAQLASEDLVAGKGAAGAAAGRRRTKPPAGYAELAARSERLERLSRVVEQVEADKAAMGRGRKRPVATAAAGEDGKKVRQVYRWKNERKR